MIQPRIFKDIEERTQRTRKSAEVFTPARICNKMNNFCDEEWFGYKDVFNRQAEYEWISMEDKIKFPDGKSWEDYIDSRRLEIICVEACVYDGWINKIAMDCRKAVTRKNQSFHTI